MRRPLGKLKIAPRGGMAVALKTGEGGGMGGLEKWAFVPGLHETVWKMGCELSYIPSSPRAAILFPLPAPRSVWPEGGCVARVSFCGVGQTIVIMSATTIVALGSSEP